MRAVAKKRVKDAADAAMSGIVAGGVEESVEKLVKLKYMFR